MSGLLSIGLLSDWPFVLEPFVLGRAVECSEAEYVSYLGVVKNYHAETFI